MIVSLLFVLGCKPAPTPAPAPPQVDATTVERLVDGIKKRLLLMHDVARWKWNEHKPIADPEREKQLLESLASRGQKKGVDPAFVKMFFAAQIEAAKLLQQADYDLWKHVKQGKFETAPPLIDTRARIDEVNAELLDALAAAWPMMAQKSFETAMKEYAAGQMQGDGLNEKVRAAALVPFSLK